MIVVRRPMIGQRVDHKPALRQMGVDPPAQTRAADPPHAAAAMVGHKHALPERMRQHGRQRRQTGARLVAMDHIGPQEGGYEPGSDGVGLSAPQVTPGAGNFDGKSRGFRDGGRSAKGDEAGRHAFPHGARQL